MVLENEAFAVIINVKDHPFFKSITILHWLHDEIGNENWYRSHVGFEQEQFNFKYEADKIMFILKWC